MREAEIKSKLMEIRESMDSIVEHIPHDQKEFISLGLIKDGIYKRLEYSIENVFDICAIINSDLSLGIPEEDESIIENLIQAKVLSEEWMGKLKGMKSFRNIMVHRYGRIDDRIAFGIMKERMGDFDLFIEEVEGYIDDRRNKKR
jgi:uncharacterized protein YutE (UPF0331/DUF86 family)